MGTSIELNELSDPEIKQKTESVIRSCIGDRPNGEDWKVWIHAASGHCQIVVKGPSQTRNRFFFDDSRMLPDLVRDWLEEYPFR
jgi:hypothetical protein